MPTEYTTKDIERFYAKVSKTPTEQGCLEWMGYYDRLGYGHFYPEGRKRHYAHRVAWEIVNGPIPAGLVIRHMCHNPRCVNHDHLQTGTMADNTRDMMNSGRYMNAPNKTAPYVKPVGPTESERFYAKISKTPTETGCLLWLGYLTPDGYGSFNFRGKSVRAHRVAWELENGKIPDGMVLMHVCDVPSCVRVSHLKLGTQIDNIRDRVAKGRTNHIPTCIGEAVGNSKLTADQVLEIRGARYADWTGKDIAAHFGVSESLVCMILKRKIWAHLDSSNDAPTRAAITKMTEADVLDIRGGRYEGWLLKDIADRYSVTISVIWHILHRRSWKHI